MKLHIFNPEHDISLARNLKHLTPPHAAQELRMNLGWMPALWADDGDMVLVDDVNFAVKAATKFKEQTADVLFVEKTDLKNIIFDRIDPWGWDKTLWTMLLEYGINSDIIPDEEWLIRLRVLSNRRTTIGALAEMRRNIEKLTCGEGVYVTSEEGIKKYINKWRHVVIKAPWSSSGRGVRYIDQYISDSNIGFIRRIINTQGGVMIEPYYNKVKDFGMEFMACADGTVKFLGLSLFQTINGAYAGNILADEQQKTEMLEEYLSLELIETTKQRACSYFSRLMSPWYVGPFGIDMMIVAQRNGKGFLLHPCVEVNVRRTMGHVALALSPTIDAPKRLMRIVHEANYTLKTSFLENNYVKTL